MRWIDRPWVTWFIVGSVSFWLMLVLLIAMKLNHKTPSDYRAAFLSSAWSSAASDHLGVDESDHGFAAFVSANFAGGVWIGMPSADIAALQPLQQRERGMAAATRVGLKMIPIPASPRQRTGGHRRALSSTG